MNEWRLTALLASAYLYSSPLAESTFVLPVVVTSLSHLLTSPSDR